MHFCFARVNGQMRVGAGEQRRYFLAELIGNKINMAYCRILQYHWVSVSPFLITELLSNNWLQNVRF